MTDIISRQPFAAADSPMDLDETSGAPNKCDTLFIDPVANWAWTWTKKAPFFSNSTTSSFTPFLFSVVFLQVAVQDATKWHGRCLESLLRIALQIFRAIYRTHPGKGGDSANQRHGNPQPSPVSVQPSFFSLGAAGFQCRPGVKRRGNDGSDDENNGRRKRRRNDKKANGKPTIKVLCPFKLRYPGNHDFENCNAFRWTHLRQHLLQRKHKPKDRCQSCGKVFTDGGEWDQHTDLCRETPTRVFEPLICVTRDMVARINLLTSRGRQSLPIEELYEALWIILFEDVPVPDRAAWLRVVGDNGPQNEDSTPAAGPVEEHAPDDPPEPSESHASDLASSVTSNMSRLQHYSEGYDPDPTCIDPALLLTPTTQPTQSTTLSNSSVVAVDHIYTVVPSDSAENYTTEATVGAQSPRDSQYGSNNSEDDPQTNWVARAWIDGNTA